MIHPNCEIVDMDPQWGLFWEAMTAARASQSVVHLLHEDGRVLQVARGGYPIEGYREPVTDAAATARRVREGTGVDRAVVVNRTGLRELSLEAANFPAPTVTSPELRAAVDELWWSSSHVATDPAPPRNGCRDLIEGLRALGPRQAALLILRGRMAIVLVAEDGLITHISCVDPSDARAQASERVGALDAVVECEWDELFGALRAPDSLDALADVVGDASAPLADLLRRAGR